MNAFIKRPPKYRRDPGIVRGTQRCKGSGSQNLNGFIHHPCTMGLPLSLSAVTKLWSLYPMNVCDRRCARWIPYSNHVDGHSCVVVDVLGV